MGSHSPFFQRNQVTAFSSNNQFRYRLFQEKLHRRKSCNLTSLLCARRFIDLASGHIDTDSDPVSVLDLILKIVVPKNDETVLQRKAFLRGHARK
jgi:hypothetical protein